MGNRVNAIVGMFAAAFVLAAEAQAQGVTRGIVPFPPGGGLDATARVIGQRLQETGASETLVIENRPGANGVIGAKVAAQGAPDGKTWLFADGALVTVNPFVYPPDPDFDAGRDLKVAAGIGLQPAIFVVNPTFPAKNLAEFVSIAKKKQLDYASGGFGSTGHVTMAYFASVAGIDMHHVAYRGGAPAMNDLLGGHVSSGFVAIGGAMPLVKSGQLRALAVSSRQRSPDLPDVPTVQESGYPGFEVQSAFFVMVPSKTPADVIRRIYEKLQPVLADSGVKDRLRNLGIEAQSLSPEQAASWLATDRTRWERVVRELGIRSGGG